MEPRRRTTWLNRREALQCMTAASVATLGAAEERETMTKRPNILLVHCHDLGQYLHCYGRETVQSPNIDALASEGVLFERSFCTAPQCSPSRASLYTGRYPHNTGMLGLCHGVFAWDLHPEERHLGQILKDAGYRTAGAGVIHETHGGPRRCGLDEFDFPVLSTQAVDNAIARLKQFATDARTPFYMQVGFIEPHRLPQPDCNGDHFFRVPGVTGPDTALGLEVPGYLRDTEGTRQDLAELQGMIQHMDRNVGRLKAAVDELGLAENTVLIFTTDHGVAMPRAKCSLYDPGLGVAFVLRLPSRDGWHGGIRHSAMISNVDYVPTLLDLLGIPVPDAVQGRSFRPLLDGEPYVPRDAVFGELTYHDYYDPKRCIRTERHKLILNFSNGPAFMDPTQTLRPRPDTIEPPNGKNSQHEVVELYDLEQDPWELNNVAGDAAYADIRATLVARLSEHLRATDDPLLKGAVAAPIHHDALRILSG